VVSVALHRNHGKSKKKASKVKVVASQMEAAGKGLVDPRFVRLHRRVEWLLSHGFKESSH
jgi:hypothetical protein